MENKRNYKYDNLKCIMIFLVVFGHFLEMLQGELSNKLYIIIYIFHMPIFVYISGYFSNGSTKRIIKLAYIYLIWQTIFYLFDTFILNIEIKYSLILPNWTLWYVFAMMVWNVLIKIFNKFVVKKSILSLVIAISASLLAGYFTEIEYKFSLSRIITFLPYFLLGYIHRNVEFDKSKFKYINKYKNWLISILGFMSIIYFIKNSNTINPYWLYGAYPYAKLGYNFIFKTMWLILSLIGIYISYKIVPNKRLEKISDIGANTLTIYLLHSLIIKWLKVNGLNVFSHSEIINIVIMITLTCGILVVLGNKYVTKGIGCLINLNNIKEKRVL